MAPGAQIVGKAPFKSKLGRYFEDFKLGQRLVHAAPRTLTEGDAALYIALTGQRYAITSSDSFARDCGMAGAPLEPWLVFHTVFGKSVPDISANAVANLGYAEGRFMANAYPGDSVQAVSEVIGLKENANGKTGIVYVRTRGENQSGETLLEFVRWVMVQKRDAASPAPTPVIPRLDGAVSAAELFVPEGLSFEDYDYALAGARWAYGDYAVGEKIDHIDGMTIEEAEHQLATRLYQNTARVHFDALAQAASRFGRRLIYGGVTISIARALAFNGLENAGLTLALNGGRHVAPVFAGDTIYAWSEVLDKAELAPDIGALRLRLVAARDHPCADFPLKLEDGADHPAIVLDLDYWAAVPIKR